MNKFTRIFTGAMVLSVVASFAQAQSVAYVGGPDSLWDNEGQDSVDTAMTTTFGAEGVGWDNLFYAGGATPFTSGQYGFIYLEGGDSNAIDLDTYLTANRSAIESFVSNGGCLLLNSAPNEGGDIDFGFGGITMIDGDNARDVSAANGAHAVFNGPNTPVGTSFSGSSFAHGHVSGGGISAIITDDSPPAPATNIVLGEKSFGSGRVVVGAMTTNNFHDPQPEAANLKANILSYAASQPCASTFVPTPSVPVPIFTSVGLIALILGMLGISGARLRRGRQNRA